MENNPKRYLIVHLRIINPMIYYKKSVLPKGRIMVIDSFPSLRYAQAAEFSMQNDAFCHCKTIPFYIFAQAFEGHYEIEADGEIAVCEEGGAFFVPPNTPLKIWHYVNPKSGVMRVRFVHFIPEDPQGFDPFSQYHPTLAVSRDACRKPEKIIQHLLESPQTDKFLYASEFLRLLSCLQSFMKPREKRCFPEVMEKLLRWIEKHASEKISTADLEKAVSFSRSKLFTLFRTATGMSPGDYILKARIHYAAKLMLSDPELTVKEISDICSWKTPYHFSRIFHQIMGVSPGKFLKSGILIPEQSVSKD